MKQFQIEEFKRRKLFGPSCCSSNYSYPNQSAQFIVPSLTDSKEQRKFKKEKKRAKRKNKKQKSEILFNSIICEV